MWALYVSVWGILNKTFKNSRAPERHINQKGKKFHLLGILKSHLEPTKYNQCQKRVKKYITVSHTKLPSVPTHPSPSWEVRTDGGRGFPFLLRMLLTALCLLGFFASTILLLLCWHPGWLLHLVSMWKEGETLTWPISSLGHCSSFPPPWWSFFTWLQGFTLLTFSRPHWWLLFIVFS